MFNHPNAMVADSQSNIFRLGFWQLSKIRKISPDRTVTTFAGGGNQTTGMGRQM